MRIIEKSCQHFSNTQRRFSFNLTMNDIKDKTMSNWIIDVINQYNVGEYLTIELVESTDYELKSDYLLNFLDKIKTLGCKIAIDDFGSGYSNFEYLMRMPIDIIKIDGTLIKNIHKDKKAFEILKTLIQFCKAMNLKVVTEYVETIENFELLKSLNVDYFQGYYFHEPELLHASTGQSH
jgi:EAL domain-containing protein (putative c-di-GMP-specific phosphodiesterase class I)